MTAFVSPIAGVSLSGTIPTEPPTIMVIGPPKVGKSTLATTLIGWPEPGMVPLVLAFDPTGPDSCAALGYPVPTLKVRDQVGGTWMEKSRTALSNMEAAFRSKRAAPFGSVLVDCASTMIERLHEDAARTNTNPDKRSTYGIILEQAKEIMCRLHDLQVPIVWLAWMKESFIEETPGGEGQPKKKRQIMGGPLITGNFRARLAGTVHMIAILDKINVGPNAAGADSQGYQRVLRTKTFNGVEAGGRYNLPDPFPAHLGYMFDAVMQRGAFTPQPAPVEAADASQTQA
jgi:hypothetical protein